MVAKLYCWIIYLFYLWMNKHNQCICQWTKWLLTHWVNTLRPRQNGFHFPDDILKWIFLNENIWILIKISLKFVFEVRINNIPALVQIMAWHRSGDKPLSEPVVVSLLMHVCVTQPQWVKKFVLVVQWWLSLLTHICVTRLHWSLWHIYVSMNSIWFHYVPLYRDNYLILLTQYLTIMFFFIPHERPPGI